MKSIFAQICVALCLATFAFADTPACTMPASAASTAPAMKLMKSLAGNWESDKADDKGSREQTSFKTIAADSVVVETMMVGTPMEMMNAYHADGDRVIATHYCAEGVQPRMKLTMADDKSLKFEYLDCTNCKPGQGCMGGLQLNVDGDKLTETWLYHNADGTMSEPTVFSLHRKA